MTGSSTGWEVVNDIYKREACGAVRTVEEPSSSILGTNWDCLRRTKLIWERERWEKWRFCCFCASLLQQCILSAVKTLTCFSDGTSPMEPFLRLESPNKEFSSTVNFLDPTLTPPLTTTLSLMSSTTLMSHSCWHGAHFSIFFFFSCHLWSKKCHKNSNNRCIFCNINANVWFGLVGAASRIGRTHGRMECLEPCVQFYLGQTTPITSKSRTKLEVTSTIPPPPCIG